MREKLRSPVWRIGLLAVGGFLLYGTWAFGVNYRYGLQVALSAGFAQGTSSAIATACNTAVAEYCFARFGASRLGIAFSALLPPTLSMMMHATAQWLVGTPNIFVTILPSSLLGFFFAAIYIRGLLHFGQKE